MKLNFFRQLLLSCLQSCPLCGVAVLSDLGVCDFCTHKMRSSINDLSSSRRLVKGLDTLALWEWNIHNDETLRRLLWGLKEGKGSFSLRDTLVHWLIARSQLEQIINKKKWVVVPSPAKNQNKKDHAVQLALLIAKHLQIEIVYPLRRVNKSIRQHFFNRSQRYRSVKVNMELIQPLNDDKNVIFVDDVITTGATAQRARTLLGSPGKFQVWVLARRWDGIQKERRNQIL